MAKQLNKDTRKNLYAGALVRTKAEPLINREEQEMELVPVPDDKHDWEFVQESADGSFIFRCLGEAEDDE